MNNQVRHVLANLCGKVGTPMSDAVKRLLDSGDVVELQKLKVRPSNYGCSESYWRDALVVDLLRKCNLDTAVDKEAVAISTFYSCEAKNAETNARLNRFVADSSFYYDPADLAVDRFINEMRKDIQMVLGSLPDYLTPRFSSGATFADTGRLITTPDKMSSHPTITSGARLLLPLWGDTAWSRALVRSQSHQSDPRTVRGNIFFCVPKDGKTFRGCAKEASLNVAYQLDVGRLIKDRLLRIGIDLRQGQSYHRALAKFASVEGDLATIDMSNASDLLAKVLPKLLLPSQWYALLDSLRSTHTRVKGKWFRLEKFSSMGNGFTFELETLIFASLARTIVRLSGGDPKTVSCYGDDLIVPSDSASAVLKGLEFFGFTPNKDKTFVTGRFRESCGGDFFDGTPVRAHFLEELPDEPQHWISLANGLRRTALSSLEHRSQRWAVVREAWSLCVEMLPTHIRSCVGPDFLGDIVLHDDNQENWGWTRPGKRRDPRGSIVITDGWETVRQFVRAYVPIPIVLPWTHWKADVQLACCTLGLPSDGITPRDGVSGWRIGKVLARPSKWLPQVRVLS